LFDWKLDFIICFDLLSIRLSPSYNSGHEFGWLLTKKKLKEKKISN
jgi:hypothetical protein